MFIRRSCYAPFASCASDNVRNLSYHFVGRKLAQLPFSAMMWRELGKLPTTFLLEILPEALAVKAAAYCKAA